MTATLEHCADLHDRLVRQLTVYCRDRDLAEDVAQDVIVAAARQGDALGRIESLWPWMWRVAVNRTHDVHRRRELAGRERWLDPEGGDPTDPADAVTVRTLVANLPGRQREVLWLRHVEQRTVAETAQVLGVPTGTVKSISSRALAELRVAMTA